MSPVEEIDGQRDQAEGSGERGGGEGFETKYGVRRRLSYGRRGSGFGGVNQQRDDGLKETERLVSGRGLGRGLRV